MFRCSGQIISGPMRMNGNSQSYLSRVDELLKLNYERERSEGRDHPSTNLVCKSCLASFYFSNFQNI